VSKKRTFWRRAGRAGHDGRQYTPVVRTANTNAPSAALSRAAIARQRAASVENRARGVVRMGTTVSVWVVMPRIVATATGPGNPLLAIELGWTRAREREARASPSAARLYA
jgi:hypothetical protein